MSIRSLRDDILVRSWEHISQPYEQPTDDLIIGDDFGNYMCGGPGTDTIYGNGGNDYIDGCEGNDILYGGAGRDVFQFWKASHDKIMDWQRGDIFEIWTLATDISQVHINTVAPNQHVVTIDGVADFSVTVLGRSFGVEDILIV